MNLPILTIEQFRRHNPGAVIAYRDSIIATDCVEDVERFKTPCRIDAITVIVCTGGTADCTVNLKQYHLEANTILVNFPDDIIQIHRADQLEAYAVLISTDLLNELQIDFRQRSDFYLDIRQNALCRLPHREVSALKPYYALLSSSIATRHAETPEVVRGLVRAFSYTIISMMRLFREQEEDEGQTPGLARNKQLFHKFMALVKLHHATARGVKFYADRLCLTPNYLSGAIKDYTGKTATEWVNEYVILEAKILLHDSELSIQEIADRLSFPSQSAFGKYFKQQVGTSPKQYRLPS